jgi:hypothetical protein
MSIPMPVTIQPMMIAPGEAPLDMSDGKLKTPPPIIEPMTSAVSGNKVSLWLVVSWTFAAVSLVVTVIRSSYASLDSSEALRRSAAPST